MLARLVGACSWPAGFVPLLDLMDPVNTAGRVLSDGCAYVNTSYFRIWHTFPVLGGGRVRQLSGAHLPCAHHCQTGEI